MTRRVKEVHVHPFYDQKSISGGKSLVYDFALIEVDPPMFPFSNHTRPICLPPRNTWGDNFYGRFTWVTGYGRTEGIEIKGKNQAACQTMIGKLQVIPNDDAKCSNIMKFPKGNYKMSQSVKWSKLQVQDSFSSDVCLSSRNGCKSR